VNLLILLLLLATSPIKLLGCSILSLCSKKKRNKEEEEEKEKEKDINLVINSCSSYLLQNE
jgi:hypothetical protein